MTLAEIIYQRSLELPEAAAREALDFIDFLGQRYGLPEQHANASVAYEAWFRSEVQRALDDPRPGIDDKQVREHFSLQRDALRARMQK